MIDIDTALARLRDLPVDPRIEGLDAAIFATLASQRAAAMPLSAMTLGIAAGFALAIGVIGSIVPTGEARAADAAPFGTPAALAPSSLLGGGQ